MFVIRCDSSAEIGSGHVMRCLNLARELVDKGHQVHFLCRSLNGDINERIMNAGFPVTEMQNHSGRDSFALDEGYDALETIDLAEDLSASTIIVDHYGAGKVWQETVHKKVKLTVIDDLADHPHDCDMLINQNLYSEGPSLYASCLDAGTRLFMGPRYAMISPVYAQRRPAQLPFRDNIQRVVIFFGASDLPNMTALCLKATLSMKEFPSQVDVVVGKNHPGKESLKDLAAQSERVTLHDFVEDFPAFLTGTDLMIGAGGTTQWERCCLGIPGVIISIADNQDKLAENLGQIGSALYLGRHESMSVPVIQAALDSIASQAAERKAMAETSYMLVDGKGAARIAAALTMPDILLLPATMEDAQRLHEWRNHPQTRAVSHNTSEIDFTAHKDWLAATLTNPEKNLLIAQAGDQPLGVLRFDYTGKSALVSVYLVPHFIGQGYGSALLKTGYLWIKANKPEIELLQASIKDDNDRSKKAFMAAGYEPRGKFFELETGRKQ